MKAYLHAHSPFVSECNSKCGWYEVLQLTHYGETA